jgi:hypothetical protein
MKMVKITRRAMDVFPARLGESKGISSLAIFIPLQS